MNRHIILYTFQVESFSENGYEVYLVGVGPKFKVKGQGEHVKKAMKQYSNAQNIQVLKDPGLFIHIGNSTAQRLKDVGLNIQSNLHLTLLAVVRGHPFHRRIEESHTLCPKAVKHGMRSCLGSSK